MIPKLFYSTLTVATVAAALIFTVSVFNRDNTKSIVSTVNFGTFRGTRRRAFQEEIPSEVIETMDSKLVDFVVGGFQKCGTTYLQNKILYPSKRLFIPHHETHFLQNDKYSEFVNEFVNVTKYTDDGRPILSGYKSPFELGHHRSLRNLEALFPDVKMIITLRHPVLQFESLYNYKLRQSPEPLPPVDHFVGTCGESCSKAPNQNNVLIGTISVNKEGQKCLDDVSWCTGVTNYHQYLSRLGLTPMNTPEEMDLLGHHKMSIHHFWKVMDSSVDIRGANESEDLDEGKLFLIEIGQFDNRVNQSMADDVNTDLERFLGLDYGDLQRAPPREGDKKPKQNYSYPSGYEGYVLDICLDRYKPIRDVLLDGSKKAVKWIMEYLLHPSNRDRVIVSNIDIFERMLENWKVDPCLDEDEEKKK